MTAAERLAREQEAYNEGEVLAQSTKLQRRFDHVFKGPDAQAMDRAFAARVAAHAAGKDVLEIGCYAGGLLRQPSLAVARSRTGIDLSEVAVREIGRLESQGEQLLVADAHRLPFADGSFDVVCGRSIVHHLAMDDAVGEIARVLRPGGYGIFLEPLGDNPIWKLGRLLTPRARTADELPLRRHQVVRPRAALASDAHGFIGFTTVPLAMVTSLVGLRPDNALLRGAAALDRGIARTPLRWWMRQILLVWRRC